MRLEKGKQLLEIDSILLRIGYTNTGFLFQGFVMGINFCFKKLFRPHNLTLTFWATLYLIFLLIRRKDRQQRFCDEVRSRRRSWNLL